MTICPPPKKPKTQNKAQKCTRLAAAEFLMKCGNETLQQAEGPMNKTLGACLSEGAIMTALHNSHRNSTAFITVTLKMTSCR